MKTGFHYVYILRTEAEPPHFYTGFHRGFGRSSQAPQLRWRSLHGEVPSLADQDSRRVHGSGTGACVRTLSEVALRSCVCKEAVVIAAAVTNAPNHLGMLPLSNSARLPLPSDLGPRISALVHSSPPPLRFQVSGFIPPPSLRPSLCISADQCESVVSPPSRLCAFACPPPVPRTSALVHSSPPPLRFQVPGFHPSTPDVGSHMRHVFQTLEARAPRKERP